MNDCKGFMQKKVTLLKVLLPTYSDSSSSYIDETWTYFKSRELKFKTQLCEWGVTGRAGGTAGCSNAVASRPLTPPLAPPPSSLPPPRACSRYELRPHLFWCKHVSWFRYANLLLHAFELFSRSSFVRSETNF